MVGQTTPERANRPSKKKGEDLITIYEYLTRHHHTGRSQAISMTDLAYAFQMSERELRKQILQERNQGSLICSGSSGYYLPADNKEINDFVQMKKKSIFSSWSAIAPALKAQKIDAGQITIAEFLQLKKEQM